jgi:single-stranded-DNA-specific exonuclease
VENVDAFRTRFEAIAAARITEDMRAPTLHIDAEIDLDRIKQPFVNLLKQFGPFGPGNMSPVFVSRGLRASDVGLVGSDKTHLRFKVYQPGKTTFPMSAIAFKLGHLFREINDSELFDMVYCIEENHWKDKVTLQLQVKDIRVVG